MTASSTNGAGQTFLQCDKKQKKKKNKRDQILSLALHKTQLQLIKNSTLRSDTLNLLEEKVGNTGQLTGTGRGAMNKIPTAQALRPTINKRKLLKLKSFCAAKKSVK